VFDWSKKKNFVALFTIFNPWDEGYQRPTKVIFLTGDKTF